MKRLQRENAARIRAIEGRVFFAASRELRALRAPSGARDMSRSSIRNFQSLTSDTTP
ncbi:hypothetical protein SAMN04487939_104166 [Lysobacter sp. yr284]|uniref:hypothetical protein n=1 Tax=Lysobacter sp. yr284 TaxID=1761791 RepID=UPI0008988A1C|nr:hypothetical protein [Lysobacter sp. yr284]SDY63398.1 hypothetical protein SAMN04487939_104166 [Lysobacter sp. yr284]